MSKEKEERTNNEEERANNKEQILEDTEKSETVEEVQNGENDEFKEKYVRLLAEFTNFQRQKDDELKSMAKFGNKNLLLKVIDILDDIEMGLMQENIHEDTKNILTILQSKLSHLLSLEGVSEIELKSGDDFDSSKSEALTMIEDEENKGKISQVARKGYMISDRVLRTAKVIVGK